MEEAEASRKPRDAKTVEAILKSMGVESYDPRVVCQLLELLHRYVSSILTDSREFSEHAEKSAIDIDDIRLAIRSKCAFNFTQPPPRDVTMRLAAERNAIPLPPVDQRAGVALPPNDCQLTAQNYRVVLNAKRSPGKTSHSSPKRPRLMSSPAKTSPAAPRTVRAPDRTPGSSKIASPGNAKSPARMDIDSPLKKTPVMTTPPKSNAVVPSSSELVQHTSPTRQSPHTTNNAESSKPSPGKQLAEVPSERQPAQTTDVVMLDTDTTPGEQSKELKNTSTQPATTSGRAPSNGTPGITSAFPASTPSK